MASLNGVKYTIDAITELAHYPEYLKTKLHKLSRQARQKKQKLQELRISKNS